MYILGLEEENLDLKNFSLLMLKKKYNLQKQLFLKHNFRKNFLSTLLVKSLSLNHFICPLERISFFSKSVWVDHLFYKFSTFQKLHCLISLSPKVSSRRYHYSRFFLNKQFEKLTISNTLK